MGHVPPAEDPYTCIYAYNQEGQLALHGVACITGCRRKRNSRLVHARKAPDNEPKRKNTQLIIGCSSWLLLNRNPLKSVLHAPCLQAP